MDPADVAARLEGAPQPFSKGALHGFTFTRRDQELFGEDVRARLFGAIATELGEAELIRRSDAPHAEWWQTQAGETAESLLGVFDIPVAHVSTSRAPIRRWQRTIAWVGLLGAGLFTAFSFGLLFPLLLVWRRSYNRWLDGSIGRPTAAITLGAITVGLPVAMAVVAAFAALVSLVPG
ncbi:MAG: hypothetical protein EHM57_05380 [Actinobacteria bacterium]|nr:MAG: hypothetical protein EHM57_05380 [Actinomycetota bacterium]